MKSWVVFLRWKQSATSRKALKAIYLIAFTRQGVVLYMFRETSWILGIAKGSILPFIG